MWYVGVSAINRIINCMGCDRLLGQVSINAFCATMSVHGYVGDTDCTRQTISAVPIPSLSQWSRVQGARRRSSNVGSIDRVSETGDRIEPTVFSSNWSVTRPAYAAEAAPPGSLMGKLCHLIDRHCT